MEWVGTESQVADPLTKALPAAKLEHIIRLLGMKRIERKT